MLSSDKTGSEGTGLMEFIDDEPGYRRYGFFSHSGLKAAESEKTAFIDLTQMFE